MGKTSRWVKSLLGMKKDNQAPINIPPGDENDIEKKKKKKEKRRWSFTHSRTDPVPPPTRRMSLNIGWSSEHEHDEAIAVAGAAAEAAVAAAQAAMAVVRLSSKGRSRVRWAALKIQNVFRGYLARKALRALKGLVKLQAHFRGYLVRKRAAATLQSMQALVRAQATARFLRHNNKITSDCCYEDTPPKIVEIDTEEYYMCPYSMSGPYLTPARLSLPSRRYDYNSRTSTAQSTPRFSDRAQGPFAQSRPVWDDGPFRMCQYRQPHPPNYMASTQSFDAKSTTRSQSAPKQRLNHPSPSPSKKKMPLDKLMECRHSLSAVKMNRSYSDDRQALHF